MNDPFYVNGLHFTCTQCSQCCRHDPGYVFLTYEDLDQLLIPVKCSKEEFINMYCKVVDINGLKRLSLKEKSNFDCIFWESGGCSVYEYRPLQCRSYPFWSNFLDSRKSWDSLKPSCPGVNKGELHKKEEIDYWLRLREEAVFITLK